MQENRGPFAQGGANTAYARYFVGNSYLNMLSTEGVVIGNVTFEPGCRNNWHIHEAASGGGQILLCTSGRGWYQEWGKPARELHAGDVVHIPAGVKHWHGAARDSWFVHLAVEVPGRGLPLPVAGACQRRGVCPSALGRSILHPVPTAPDEPAGSRRKKEAAAVPAKTAAAECAREGEARAGKGRMARPGRTRSCRRRSAGPSRHPAWTSYDR